MAGKHDTEIATVRESFQLERCRAHSGEHPEACSTAGAAQKGRAVDKHRFLKPRAALLFAVCLPRKRIPPEIEFLLAVTEQAKVAGERGMLGWISTAGELAADPAEPALEMQQSHRHLDRGMQCLR